ncbi:hypothetical protein YASMINEVIRUS_553 [Yasminevirus sp. GU-2018]|uniref:Uncharacterized protein n=1 Tax=Yasminevirus sp. GU-2018 TaxID=2420051 RepID=A0A5K0U8F4_9VIRU|nr:hypothetical protein YASMINEVIRUS_553 [Yasminevirus sp. GU-2018]
MSDLLDYIKMQKNRGMDDYQTLKSAKRYAQNGGVKKLKMTGGDLTLTPEQAQQIITTLETVKDKDQPDYQTLLAAASGESLLLPNYNDFESEVVPKLQQLVQGSGKVKQTVEKEQSLEDPLAETTVLEDPVLLEEGGQQQEIVPPGGQKPEVQVQTYEVLKPQTILFHPSQDVKRFSDSMIFVDLKKVLDRNTQRSFSMFFTPNEEYARRYSGLWSLNKRPVFVHKLQVKEGRPITGIKVIDAAVIPDSMDNLDLAKGMCGPTEDGTINGIKVEQKLDNSASVEEYYICNPEIWFDLVETWMQFGSTEWVKITKENTKTIQVPPNRKLDKDVNVEADLSLTEV